MERAHLSASAHRRRPISRSQGVGWAPRTRSGGEITLIIIEIAAVILILARLVQVEIGEVDDARLPELAVAVERESACRVLWADAAIAQAGRETQLEGRRVLRRQDESRPFGKNLLWEAPWVAPVGADRV